MDPLMALLQGGDPLEEQKRMAARLRGEENMRAMLTNASQEGQGLDILNFVTQNANNKPLADSVGMLTKSRQARYAPQKLDKGIMIPGTGDYQESPGVADEREADRDNKRLQVMAILSAAREATEQRAAASEDTNETRRLVGGWMADATAGRNADKAERDAAKKEATDDKEMTKNVFNFSKDQKKNGIPQLADAIGGIHELLDKPEGSIEGIGYGQETLSKIPLISDWTVGKQGKANRAKVQKLLNAVIETEAGKNVTNNEKVRQAIVNMSSDNYSEADFRSAMDVILPALENIRSNSLRGAKPEVVDTYTQNDPSGYDPRKSFVHTPKGTVPAALPREAPKDLHFDAQGRLITK